MNRALVSSLTKWRDKEKIRIGTANNDKQEAFSVGALWAFNIAIGEAALTPEETE